VPTFRAAIFNRKGFTLLEILVVIALMALFVTFALPRFQTKLELDLKRQARMLSGTIQFLYNQAALKNKTYRLRYRLEGDRHSYWVESSSEKIMLGAQKEEPRQKQASPFAMDKNLLKKPVKLEKNLKFKDILTESQPLPITHGDAYTHFFPHGYAEQTRIRIENKKGQIYTIVVQPLTGGARIYAYDLAEKE